MSLRGVSIIKKLFEEDTVMVSDEPTPQRRGRSADLINTRNECLADRFYYHSIFSGLNYSICIDELVKEFFLSKFTISEIISDYTDYILQIRREERTIQELKKKWPNFNF